MTRPAERAPQEDLQRRREMLVNYLQTVLQPDDTRLQGLITDMREHLRGQTTARVECDSAMRRDTTAH